MCRKIGSRKLQGTVGSVLSDQGFDLMITTAPQMRVKDLVQTVFRLVLSWMGSESA